MSSLRNPSPQTPETPSLAYLPRLLVLVNLPHRKPEGVHFTRVNGAYRLTLVGDPEWGLPYGAISRLLLSWICTRAVQTKSPIIALGESEAAWLRLFDITSTGGIRGSRTYARDHLMRLASTTFRASWEDEEMVRSGGFCLVDKMVLWKDSAGGDEGKDSLAHIQLSEALFEELLLHPVPLLVAALGKLRRSPMALDIYCWLTYRFFTLKRPTLISWPGLALQFGADCERLCDFRKAFRRHLRSVLRVYPTAKVIDLGLKGVKLLPSPPDVPIKEHPLRRF